MAINDSKVVLDTPDPSVTEYRVSGLRVQPGYVVITVSGDVGPDQRFSFDSSLASQFITLMNTGDHSVTPLSEKILTFLINNGYLGSGTVSTD